MRVLALAVLLGGWWAASAVVGGEIIPTPVAVAERIYHVWTAENFLLALGRTLQRVVLGMLGTLVLAMAVGISMGVSRRAARFFDIFVLLGRTIPGLVWALLAVMIIGISTYAPVLAVVLAITPMVTVQFWEGTRALDRELFEMAGVYQVGRYEQVRHILLPAMGPAAAAAGRLALSLSWKVVILAELFGVEHGVGAAIFRNFSVLSIDGVLAWTLSFAAVMAVIEFGILNPIYARLTRWHVR